MARQIQNPADSKSGSTWIPFECRKGGSRWSETEKSGDMLKFFGQTKDGDTCYCSGCTCKNRGTIREVRRTKNGDETCDWFRKGEWMKKRAKAL